MLSSEGGSGKGGPSVGDLLIDYFDGRETATATATATAATETAAATKANDAAASNEKLSRFNHQEHHLHSGQGGQLVGLFHDAWLALRKGRAH